MIQLKNDGIYYGGKFYSSVSELPEQFKNGAVLQDGRKVPVYQDAQGVKALVTLPSCGTLTLLPAEEAVEEPAEKAEEAETAKNNAVEKAENVKEAVEGVKDALKNLKK